jgi:hypothetical protein
MNTDQHRWGRGTLLAHLVVGIGLIVAAWSWADTYPTESYPATATTEGLNGTTDDGTGLAYIAVGTDAQSSPSLRVQYDRRLARQNAILATVNQGRVVQTGATTVGVFPADYRLAGTAYHYAGEATVAISTTDDTYYAYLDADSDDGATGDVTVVTDAAGWPADAATYIPLAEITVASNVISTVTDVRGRVLYSSADAVAATLTAIGALATTDSNVIVGNGSTWVAESGATARTSLGLAIGTNVQAYDADLGAVAGLSSAGLIARTGAGTASARTITAGGGIAVTNGDGVSGNPTIAAAPTVVADADGATLTSADNGKCYTNEGASFTVPFTLPTAAAGMVFTFVVQDGDGMTVQAATGDTLRNGATVTGAGGGWSNTTIGSVLMVLSINDTEWITVTVIGTWS